VGEWAEGLFVTYPDYKVIPLQLGPLLETGLNCHNGVSCGLQGQNGSLVVQKCGCDPWSTVKFVYLN
jgi:hypothetical protein